MSATLEATRVGAEFRGLARQFCDAVRAVDLRLEKAMPAVVAPLIARLRRHPRLRHELVVGAAHLYRKLVPDTFRLADITVRPDRDCFEVRDCRLTSTWMADPDWEGDDPTEPGVALAWFEVKQERGTIRQRWWVSALCSLHSLARWFERSGHRDHALLIRDIAVLANADEDHDAVPTADGFWLGHTRRMRSAKDVTPDGQERQDLRARRPAGGRAMKQTQDAATVHQL
jgi:hypothetical protein